MSNRDRVLDFLRSVGDDGATNAEIVSRTGIRPPQQIFQITQRLENEGLIKRLQSAEGCWLRDEFNRESISPQKQAPLNDQNTAIHDWDEAEIIDLKIELSWTPLGRVTLAGQNELIFPRVPTTPGLYRFRIRKQASEAVYIGETENLSQRFNGYRTPGINQQTNIRINQRLRADLSAGAEVAVATITDRIQIDRRGEALKVDLSLKSVRRLLENAAILAGHGSDIETLNR